MKLRSPSALRVAARYLVAVRKLWWHGTSPKNIRGILKKGLLPTGAKGTKEVYEDESNIQGAGRSMKTFGGVYLTDEFFTARKSATAASGNPKHQAFVAVTLETRSPNTLADEDDVFYIIEDVSGARAANELFSGTGFWPPALRDFRHGWKNPAYVNPTRLADVADAIWEADLSGAVAKFMKRLLHDFPRLEGRYKRQKQEIDRLVEEVLRAHAFHLIEVHFRRDRQEIEDYYENSPVELQAFKKLHPDFRNTLQTLQDATERMSRKLRETTDPESSDFGWTKRHNIRVLSPIGYRGKNRIVLVIEVRQDPSSDGKLYTDLIVHYDKGMGALDAFRKDFDQSWGGPYRVLDRNRRVLDVYLPRGREWPEDLWGPKP